MAESNFSWFNIRSVFGFAILAFLCFALLGYGINTLSSGGEAFYGIVCIIGCIICGFLSIRLYINWDKKK